MASKGVVFYLLLVFVFFPHSFQESFYDAVVKRLDCFMFEDYGNITCSVNLKNRTTSFTQVDYVLTKNLEPIQNIVMYYQFGTVFRKFMIDVTEDFCAVIQGKGFKSPAHNVIMSSLKNHSNIGTECPYKKEKHYYVKDYVLDASKFPAALPNGKYRLDMRTIDKLNNQDVMMVKLYVDMRRKIALDILWN
ncbi:uncharacterized protein DMENIID0001_115350 [Sergentomyia squamirostris]